MNNIQRIGAVFIATLFVLFFAFPVRVFAAPSSAKAIAPVVSPTPEPVIYVLPYPGILPTHPLYMLKTLRDTIIELLITDPVHKAEFYILQADKKLNMGLTLKNLGKTTEAERAFTDALASRSKALSLLESSLKSGTTVPGYINEKLMLSLAKHKEALLEVGGKVDAVEALLFRASQTLLGSGKK